jgi:mRNA-degrading endonuclease toxin of MazEF toxin-antitoxin module
MKRGDVYWADLVPRSGSEQTRRRPVIVLSHDGFNQIAGTVCHQVTTLDRGKLTKKIGTLPPDPLKEVEEGLRAAVDLD